MHLQENTVVADRFRLVRMIGRGGMGSVWQAQDCRLDNQCAVKFIEGELAKLADAQARFEREAKAAAQLRSPHVVEIKDYGVWQGRPYIAMELLDGEDLGKALAKAGGKLPPAQVGSVIQQVCRALTKAHAAGIVHRDLKPDNIFLVTDDDRQIVKILDFGVAKQTSQAIDGSNTKTGAMLGTPYYMSPEQAQGIKSVDARSDLWSLAVIVYHCITGRLPFESEALGDLLVKIIVNPIPVPSLVAPVPPGFDRWWARAADRNPDNRFQSAKDFANELALALGTTATDVTAPRPAPGFHAAATAMMGPPPEAPTGPGNYGAPATHPTPSGVAMAPRPFDNTPAPAHPSHPSFGDGQRANPQTFPGHEPYTVPKKGAPVGLFLGIGAVVCLGLAAAGFVALRRPQPTVPTPVTSTAAPTPTPTPPPSAVATTPTEGVAPGEPPAGVASSVGNAPSASVVTPAQTGRPGTPKVIAPPPAKASASQAPAVAPAPPAAPSASVKKWNPGF